MSNKSRSSLAVRKFHGFLETCLQRPVLAYHSEPLTKPGDNYGSIVQSVIVEVAGKNDINEVRRFCIHFRTEKFLFSTLFFRVKHYIWLAKQ